MTNIEKYRTALLAMTLSFFVIGFMSAFNDILMPHFKHLFHLSYLQMSLVSFSFFIAYGVFSVPMSFLTAQIGYRRSTLTGFILNILGGVIILTSISANHYILFLIALFIMASGVVLLLVAAMPFSVLLGQDKTASARLTFVEVFHSFGAMVAPLFGGFFLLAASTAVAHRGGSASHFVPGINMQMCYSIIMIVLLVLVLCIVSLPMPRITAKPTLFQSKAISHLLKKPAFLWCLFALFLYVGCEVSIGGFMINFAKSLHLRTVDSADVSFYVSAYWALLLVGRFIGSFILRVMKPQTLVLLCTLGSIVMILLSYLLTDYVSLLCLVTVGLFNSIVFPVLYSLGLKYAKGVEVVASGLLAMAVIGGAIMPMVQGQVADVTSIATSFIVPVISYFLIFLYCLLSRRLAP